MMASIRSQFGHPHGVMGQIVGWILAMENQERIAWAVQQLDLQPSDSVLEIGFGPGLGIQQALAQVPQGSVAGVDISEVMVAQARRRNAAEVQAGRVDLRQGSADHLPFGDGSFEKVFAINSLHIWPDAQAGLREVQRVLKPGGLAARAAPETCHRGSGHAATRRSHR